MKLSPLPALPLGAAGLRAAAKAAAPPVPSPGPDLVEPGPVRVFGSVGAMAGALSGRALAVAGAGWLGLRAAAALAPAGLPGIAAAVAGTALGLYAGYRLEKHARLGRLVGGLAGGAAGVALGAVAALAGVRASERLARECAGFTFSSLPRKLVDPDYTSHATMRPADYAAGLAMVQPGDILITSDDRDFKLEIMQKLMGYTADWTHVAIADESRGAMDILITQNQPSRWPLEFLFEDNMHAMVLRPRYQPGGAGKTLDSVRSTFGRTTYDHEFDLASDDAQYCQELIWKGLRNGDPSIDIKPRKILGRDFVGADDFIASPDLDVVWSSGSNFWINWLSKFN